MTKLEKLLCEVRQCKICAEELPFAPNPVLRARRSAKLLIIGQAPGTKVHQTGIPWNDPSGERLRSWMSIDRETFYDDKRIAIIPMGFCYPGKGKSGDLPPRKECAQLWHSRLLELLPKIELTLLIGQYAQHHYLSSPEKTLAATVKRWREYLPGYFPLPHPSPRNQLWLKQHSWFEKSTVPELKRAVQAVLC